MRALFLLFAFAFSMVLPGTSSAMLPESGWYWNPAESGRGFNIEIQDDKLSAAAFVYAPDGTPAWYVAAGRMASDRTFSAPMYQTQGGQCIGCAYPGSPGLVEVGTMTITFTTPENAVITAMGVTMNVQRHDFSSTNLFNPTALYGEWSTTEGDPIFPLYFGDRITFRQVHTAADGKLYASGSRTGASSRISLGRCENRGLCVVAFSFSSSSDEYYTFSFHGFGRMEGLVQIVSAGRAPTAGAGFYFLATRTKSKAYVQGFSAPAMSKDAPLVDESAWDAMASAKHRLQGAQSVRAKALAESFAAAGAEELRREIATELARLRQAEGTATFSSK